MPESDESDSYIDPAGTVYVISNKQGEWSASWQSDHLPGGYVALDGVTRDAAIAWARKQPAGKHIICEPGSNDYQPLETEDSQ